MAATTYDFDPVVKQQIELLKTRFGLFTAKAAIQRAISLAMQLSTHADPELGTVIVQTSDGRLTVLSLR